MGQWLQLQAFDLEDLVELRAAVSNLGQVFSLYIAPVHIAILFFMKTCRVIDSCR